MRKQKSIPSVAPTDGLKNSKEWMNLQKST
jgi:hypothetical protein